MGNYWLNLDYASDVVDRFVSKVNFNVIESMLKQDGLILLYCYISQDSDGTEFIESFGYIKEPQFIKIIGKANGDVLEYQWTRGQADFTVAGQAPHVKSADVNLRRYQPKEIINIQAVPKYRHELIHWLVLKDVEIRKLKIDYFELYKHVFDECNKRNMTFTI